MPRTITRSLGGASSSATRPVGAGDANTGGGYGSLKSPELGADNQAEEVWPYTQKTRLEQLADDLPDREDDNRRAVRKRDISHYTGDKIRQLSYKTGSFVNGSTRGLTGIMAHVDPMPVLEMLVSELVRNPPPRERMKPIGAGGIAPMTMSPDMTTRTRPGMTLGSKQGWFGPPEPKTTDPSMDDPVFDLRDLASSEKERPLRRSRLAIKRVRSMGDVHEGRIAVLRSYVALLESNSELV